MNIMLDIDDTITAVPELFSLLSRSAGIARVIIVSSRTNNSETRSATITELQSLDVHYDRLYLIESVEYAKEHCPHPELDWYQQWMWQKIDICLKEQVDVVFEDDQKVIHLFKKLAPQIRVLQVHKS